MKRIPAVMIFLLLVLYGKAENPPSDKDKAVACIKRWEGWHRGKMPYIGYGHRYPNFNIITTSYCKYLKYNGQMIL